MTAERIKSRINELCTHMTFEYNGKNCGVDPISHSHFEMWCGENSEVVHSINDVMNICLFDGKSLNTIAGDIKIIDF